MKEFEKKLNEIVGLWIAYLCIYGSTHIYHEMVVNHMLINHRLQNELMKFTEL